MDNNRKIDITGMCCSVPIIKISKELKDMQSGLPVYHKFNGVINIKKGVIN